MLPRPPCTALALALVGCGSPQTEPAFSSVQDPGSSTATPEQGTTSTGATSEPGGTSGPQESSTGASSTTHHDPSTGDASGDDGSTTATDPAAAALSWLFDLESGSVASPDGAHDGAELDAAGCADVEDAFVVSGEQPVHSGDFSLAVRFEQAWLEDNPDCGTVRSFFSQSEAVRIEEGLEYWHGWAVYVPDDVGDSWTTVRWATGGQANKALSIDLLPDLTWRFRATPIGEGDFELTLSPDQVDFGDGTPEVWHEFVAHFVITTEEQDGFFQVWHRVQGDEDWTQVVDATGRTANLDAPFPFMVRHGMHSGHGWGDASSTARVLYFDEVRFADGAVAGFDDVVPGAAAGLLSR
ncbi:MAG: polysaccharide lyase [Nannocystaceae bacterium]|nr:polysaccharide lyase [Nannocystaceae bacterium]